MQGFGDSSVQFVVGLACLTWLNAAAMQFAGETCISVLNEDGEVWYKGWTDFFQMHVHLVDQASTE